MRLVWGVCEQIAKQELHLQHIFVSSKGREGALNVRPALVYTKLTGEVALGDKVLINTTGFDLDLGTGGFDIVIAKAPKSEDSPYETMYETEHEGKIMKLRYTPLQKEVCSIESQESEFHELLKSQTSIEGMPVVCCSLHSQVFAVAQAIKTQSKDCKIAYIMTDEASLLADLSENLKYARAHDLIDTCITCGQAYGGDYETVNLHSALLVAHHALKADICIVGVGPGITGTDTTFGHGGIAQGEAINAVNAVRGTAIACLRMSSEDERERHQGISHHSLSALSRIALAPCAIAIPADLALSKDDESYFNKRIDAQLREGGILTIHRRFNVESYPVEDFGLKLTSMGRSKETDPVFFMACYAAGALALDFHRRQISER